MTQRKLDNTLRRWQKRLRLQDYDISVEFADAATMDGGDAVGMCHIDWQNGTARIRVLRPEAIEHEAEHFHNVEMTIVHELIHFLLHPIIKPNKQGTLAHAVEEQVVEKIAKGLLNL